MSYGEFKDAKRVVWYLTNLSGSNTVTATADPTTPAYFEGLCVVWKQATTNTDAMTINVNGLGAKALKKDASSAMASGDCVSGRMYAAVYDGTNFQMISGNGAAGGGNNAVEWARVSASGTKRAGSGSMSSSRSAEGTYPIVSTNVAADSGGYYQYGVLVTPSAVAADGGDGVSGFNAYVDSTPKDTDDDSNGVPLFYSPYSGKLYSGGTTLDDIWVYNPTDWAATPTQVDADAVNILTGQDGVDIMCMSKEGRYLWISGDSGAALRAMDTNDNTMYNFGTDGSNNQIVYAAIDSLSSAPRIWMDNSIPITARFSPNIGTETRGAIDITYSGYDPGSGSSGYGRNVTWQDSSYFWQSNQDVYQVKTTANTVTTHTRPTHASYGQMVSMGAHSQIDLTRKRLFCFGQQSGGAWHLWVYRSWQNELTNSGTWEHVRLLSSGVSHKNCCWYDPASGVLMVVDKNAGDVLRFVGDPLVLVDVVPLVTEEYSHIFVGGCFYQHPYGYVACRQSGTDNKIVRLNYTGAAITLESGGGAIAANVLVAQYIVNNGTQATVYLYRTLNPPTLSDGEFTVEFVR